MNAASSVIIPVFFAIFIPVLVYAIIWNRRRSGALAKIADTLGFDFDDGRDHAVAEKWNFLPGLDSKNPNRYAYQVLRGQCSGHSIVIFDHHSGKENDPDQTFLILNLPMALPALTIRPISKSTAPWQYNPIPFESDEFNQAFTVESENRKFAYDVCHAQMMAFYLSARPRLTTLIKQNALALCADDLLPAKDFQQSIVQLIKIRSLLPDYLFTRP